MLVQITDGNLTGPFNLAFVRQYVTGYDIQKGGFAFAVSADKTYVLTAQELKVWRPPKEWETLVTFK